jgi:polyhydroxyalkanoate synthesis regulator phasin
MRKNERRSTMQSDQERLDGLMKKAREFSEKQILDLEKKVNGLRAKINELLDERAVILNSPFTVSETLEVAKKSLEDGRKTFFMDELLVKHLKRIQARVDNFSPVAIRQNFINDLNLYRLIYNVIDEIDLIEAAKVLDNIGMPRAERETKVESINRKVKALENEIEKLLS